MSTASAECPVCGTPISETRFAEIQEQIREEEQAKLAVHADHLRVQHEAAMKVATAEAAREARKEAEQKLTQAQLMQTQQADRIAKLEATEVALRADAANTQKQLRTQFAKDLKAATDKVANDLGAKSNRSSRRLSSRKRCRQTGSPSWKQTRSRCGLTPRTRKSGSVPSSPRI
jgi:hypothetical protein